MRQAKGYGFLQPKYKQKLIAYGISLGVTKEKAREVINKIEMEQAIKFKKINLSALFKKVVK